MLVDQPLDQVLRRCGWCGGGGDGGDHGGDGDDNGDHENGFDCDGYVEDDMESSSDQPLGQSWLSALQIWTMDLMWQL